HAKRCDEWLDDATEPATARRPRTLRRFALAGVLEVRDERVLALDEPAAALFGRVARIFEGTGPAIGEQLLELAIFEREQEQPIGHAGGERDVVRDDDRRD